tara:strand:- start:2140 stop:2703 length:564 start_codon:yes stop_codon:yes gene_type:complete
VLHTEIGKELNNRKISELCMAWQHKKIDESPNATGYEDSRIPDDPEITRLTDKVMSVVHSNIDDRYYLAEIWAHILVENQSTMIHSHRNERDTKNLFLSWVYYPLLPDKKYGGKLRFQMVSHMQMNNHEITPQVGHLVIFPSWLNHYTTPNTSEDVRISISGNLKIQEEDYQKVWRDRTSGIHDFYS